MLDSSVTNKAHGTLSQHQVPPIKSCVQKTKKPTLIAMHHHPIVSGSSWIDKQMLLNHKELTDILQQFQCVKAVLFGHIHQAFDKTLHHIRFLGCPSTCVQFKANTQFLQMDHHRPGFRVLKLHNNGLLDTYTQYI